MGKEEYRNVKLTAASNGGFIVEYDKHGKDMGRGDFTGMVYLGNEKEVFDSDDGKSALKRLIELSGGTVKDEEKEED